MTPASPVFRFRLVMGFFVFALVISGVTAFPLLSELKLLNQWFGSNLSLTAQNQGSLAFWISHVHEGLDKTYRHYPWIAYGTDWLAFAHIIIAVFFIGPMIDPVSSR